MYLTQISRKNWESLAFIIQNLPTTCINISDIFTLNRQSIAYIIMIKCNSRCSAKCCSCSNNEVQRDYNRNDLFLQPLFKYSSFRVQMVPLSWRINYASRNLWWNHILFVRFKTLKLFGFNCISKPYICARDINYTNTWWNVSKATQTCRKHKVSIIL